MKGSTGDQVRPMRVRPLRVRLMQTGDIPRVMEIADGLPDAPHWPVSAYQAAVNPKVEPRRVALVAEQVAEKVGIWFETDETPTSVAKATAHSAGSMPGINPRPTARMSFSATYEPREPGAPGPENLESGVMQPEALDSGAVVGFVVASLVAGEAELESIAVAAEAQRCGLGGQLLEHLLAALREVQVDRVNLEVRGSNGPALALYRRYGFRETGVRVGYYVDPVEDAVMMGLDLG